MAAWQFTEADQAMLEREILPFLPDRIFDAHAHLVCHEHYAGQPLPSGLSGNPDRLGLAEYCRYAEWLHPGGRTVGGLFFGLAFNGDRQANNDFVAAEVAAGRPSFKALGQMIISPEMTPDFIQAEVAHLGFVGLKCYHTLARVEGPTWQAPLESYLPEAHMYLAHQAGLAITLHLVRDRALADPLNQAALRRYCERYPNMRLILAHAGRGFNPWHTIAGVQSLAGLDNIWFDTSAVTEAGGFEAIVETLGHERLLYGTDFYISHLRGRCVAIGDSFHWLYAEEMKLDEQHITLRPALVGLESLRSLGLACRRLRLTDRQIEDIFYNNAARLFSF